MATKIKEQALSININEQQEYVNWLKDQPAPGMENGKMGINAAAHVANHD